MGANIDFSNPEEVNSLINQLNKKIDNPRDSYETQEGFEIVLESLIYKIYDVFGKNSLLSMTYQIGAGPGVEIANRIKKEKGLTKFEDPLDAVEVLLDENRRFYSITITGISKDTESDPKYDKLILDFKDRCFYRESLKKRPRLKIGGPLCRINKGYFETAFKQLTGMKTEIEYIKNLEDEDCCFERLTFYIPKQN